MDSLYGGPNAGKHKGARNKKIVTFAVIGVAAAVVVVGAILLWPKLFGGNKPTPIGAQPGVTPTEIQTPDPAAGGNSSIFSENNSGGNSAGGGNSVGNGNPGGNTASDGSQASAEVNTLLAEAEQKEAAGQLVAARQALAKAIGLKPSAAQRVTLVQRLEALSARTILEPTVAPGDVDVEYYTVQSGDSLTNIGRRFRTTAELVQRINKLPSDLIRADQKLKVIKGPFRVRVVKSTFTLELWLRDTLVKTYPVAIGAKDSTPVGTFEVTGQKLKNPTFHPPPSYQGSREVIPGGRADNPLGSRWIPFGEKSLGLGIHGTNDPDSIGKSVSLGCIRMRKDDVEFVYDCLVPGSQVEVVN